MSLLMLRYDRHSQFLVMVSIRFGDVMIYFHPRLQKCFFPRVLLLPELAVGPPRSVQQIYLFLPIEFRLWA